MTESDPGKNLVYTSVLLHYETDQSGLRGSVSSSLYNLSFNPFVTESLLSTISPRVFSLFTYTMSFVLSISDVDPQPLVEIDTRLSGVVPVVR